MGGWGFFGTITVTPALAAPGDTITINNTGSGFFDTMVVTINGVSAISITVVDHQTITCIVPAAAGSGIHDVYIQNPDGEATTLTGVLTVPGGGMAMKTNLIIGITI